MRGRTLSGSGLFLIELMLAILIFALAAAICLRIFVTADYISTESIQLNRAVLAAQSSAEAFKATGGDLNETAKLLSGPSSSAGIERSNDGSGKVILMLDYVVEIERSPASNRLIEGSVTVSDFYGEVIFSIPVSVVEVSP